jgi:two-component system nitrogen regulation response regulator GlnG
VRTIMTEPHVIVISEDHEVAQHVRDRFHGCARVTILPAARRRLPKLSIRDGHLLVLVETSRASAATLAKLLRLAHNGTAPYLVVGTPAQLIRSCDRLCAALLDGAPEGPAPHAADRSSRHPGLELTLGDFMERKFHDFVRKIRVSGGKNLMHLLRHEFEKPLITLTLKETKGNQVQAAELLGVNRNTLRKKITELKIAVTR